MKRKASAAFQDADDASGGQPPRLDECFLAAEILPRLSAHAAQTFAAASTFFRGILTDPDFWLGSPRRAPAPAPLHAACLVVRGGGGAAAAGAGLLLHEFHYAEAGFTAEPAVSRAAGGSLSAYRLAGACNGLVLLAAPWSKLSRARGVLFNPASGEEAAIAADMPGGRRVFHRFCGLGYSPSSKSYKALLCVQDLEINCGGLVELMVVKLNGGASAAGDDARWRGETPRRVLRIRCGSPDPSSLTLDGKVYVLPNMWSPEILVFDADEDTVTFVERPPEGRPASELMEVWGRPCVATEDYGAAMSKLWTLTPVHQWELKCWFAAAPSPTRPWSSGYGDMVHGAWDCGDGFLLVTFRGGRCYMYDLREELVAVARVANGGGSTHNDLLPAELRKATFCWGYQPTLIPPATVLGDAACHDDERGGFGHFSSGHIGSGESGAVVRRDRCLESLMEMMRKRP